MHEFCSLQQSPHQLLLPAHQLAVQKTVLDDTGTQVLCLVINSLKSNSVAAQAVRMCAAALFTLPYASIA